MTMNDIELQRMNKVLRHRLRNFASGIKSAAAFLAKELEGRLEPREMEYFPLMLHECDALSALTARFNLLFDDVPPGGEVSTGDLCRALAARMRESFPTTSVTIRIADEMERIVITNEQYVSIPLMELLTNAVEAAPGKAVSLEGCMEQDRLVFRVGDQGPGLNRELTMDQLFQPFMTTKARHLGMGLAIAKRLSARRGGELTAEQRAEGGLQFVMRLPPEAESAAG